MNNMYGNQPNYQYEQYQANKAPKVKKTFTGMEVLFAWLLFIAGYLFNRALPVTDYPFGCILVSVGIFLLTFIYMKKDGAEFGIKSYLVLISAVIMLPVLLVSSNTTILCLAYIYIICAYIYWVYCTYGNSIEKNLSNLFVLDAIRAAFLMPFSRIADIFMAISNGVKGKKFFKIVKYVVLGMLIAFLPTLLIIILLSYDQNFTKLLFDIFKLFTFKAFFSHLLSFLGGVLIAMFVFGLYISSKSKSNSNSMSADSCKRGLLDLKKMPTLTAYAALFPMLFIYVLFFISQKAYYLSAFTGQLPADFVYSQYARDGFFQLCIICGINTVVMIVLSIFMKQNEGRTTVGYRILSVVLSICTLMLITTAVAKMVMYINAYGLTQKRVYATWFMLLLTLVFIFIIIKQFVKKINLAAAILLSFFVMFSGLSLANVDNIIASYNVDAYIEGRLDTIDVKELKELGYSATDDIVKLSIYLENSGKLVYLESIDDDGNKTIIFRNSNNYENDIYYQAHTYLSNYVLLDKQKDYNVIFSLNIPRIKANNSVMKWQENHTEKLVCNY